MEERILNELKLLRNDINQINNKIERLDIRLDENTNLLNNHIKSNNIRISLIEKELKISNCCNKFKEFLMYIGLLSIPSTLTYYYNNKLKND